MSVSDEFHTPHSSPMLNYFTPPEQREDYATTEYLELLEIQIDSFYRRLLLSKTVTFVWVLF